MWEGWGWMRVYMDVLGDVSRWRGEQCSPTASPLFRLALRHDAAGRRTLLPLWGLDLFGGMRWGWGAWGQPWAADAVGCGGQGGGWGLRWGYNADSRHRAINVWKNVYTNKTCMYII